MTPRTRGRRRSQSATSDASTEPNGAREAELELRRHFQGRRDGQRLDASLPVELVGIDRNLRARTVNLSSSGALLEVVEEGARRRANKLISYCDEISRLFSAGGTVSFGGGLTRSIRVVRVTAGGLGREMAPLVACTFTERLAPADFVRIGMPAPGEDEEASDSDPEQWISPDRIGDLDGGASPAIQELLRWAVEFQATDIHIKAGKPPRMRVNGILSSVCDEPLSETEANAMVRNFLSPEEWEILVQSGDLDTSFVLEGLARFRINVFFSRRSVGMVLHRVPEKIPDVASLGLSPVCLALAEKKRGLVLVSGAAGSGKSATVAAMLRHINATRPCHIVTLEERMDFVHEDLEAQVTQRQVGSDTSGIGSDLRRLLRLDPDVIAIHDLSDCDSIRLAIRAADAGRLVIAEMYTRSVVQTLERLVDVFPLEQQRQIRVPLAENLEGILCQALVPMVEDGMTVAQEILTADHEVRCHIRDGDMTGVRALLSTEARDGRQTLEDSLNRLVAAGVVRRETAVEFATEPERIRERDA